MEWVIKDGVPDRMETAKQVVADYLNSDDGRWTLPYPIPPVDTDDIYIVWFCKVLQNFKVLLSTDVVSTGIYFEVTFNGNNGQMYLDHYKKVSNQAIEVTL
jgi:hypothetical protein